MLFLLLAGGWILGSYLLSSCVDDQIVLEFDVLYS